MSLLFTPLLMLGALAVWPYCSVRMSLLLGGHPFARVVPKEQLDVFKYVHTDHMRSRAIVFSGSKPIGWIYAPMPSGFPHFVPFSGKPAFSADNDGLLDTYMVFAWYWRWLLLPAQALVLLLWLRERQRKARYATVENSSLSGRAGIVPPP